MKTPRPLARMRRAVAGLAIASGLLMLAGCDPRALVYFLQPFEPTIKPPCPTLKGKKVVVLTHATADAQTDFQGIDLEIAQKLVPILRQHVKKVEVVDAEKVHRWSTEHTTWTNPAEAAEAFDADIVVFLEVDTFQIQSPISPGLFEGNSKVHVQVYEWASPKDDKGRVNNDLPKKSEQIYDAECDSQFPRVQGALPMDSGISRPAFKRKFLDVVVSEVSWHFIEHAPGDNVQDLKFNQQ